MTTSFQLMINALFDRKCRSDITKHVVYSLSYTCSILLIRTIQGGIFCPLLDRYYTYLRWMFNKYLCWIIARSRTYNYMLGRRTRTLMFSLTVVSDNLTTAFTRVTGQNSDCPVMFAWTDCCSRGLSCLVFCDKGLICNYTGHLDLITRTWTVKTMDQDMQWGLWAEHTYLVLVTSYLYIPVRLTTLSIERRSKVEDQATVI